MKISTEKQIKCLQPDNGAEFDNMDFENYSNESGIARRFTVWYTPHQNGVAERKKRILVEMAKCMILG